MDRVVRFVGSRAVDIVDPSRPIWQAAVDTLTSNWTGAATLPSRSQYPHQWSWDSAFIAIGLAQISQERAQRELLGLLGAQWRTGRLPHIVYNDATDETYFPGPRFWASRHMPGAPAVSTSGIVQPPVHARAALTVFTQATDQASGLLFLAAAYPKLAAQHRYLIERRDIEGGGLASIVHPWESGMDNSPAWDPFLAGLTRSRPFTRKDLRHVPAAERPSDADYSAYVALAENYRDLAYDDRRLAAEHPFTVEDPLFNGILLDAELCLAEIARLVGRDPAPHRTAAKAIHHALMARLWDEELGTFVARDARTGAGAATATIGGFAPLLSPWLPAVVRERLVRLLLSPGFLGGCGYPVPTTDLRAPAFDRRRYWRGPTWVNTNWLVWLGTLRAGRPDVASSVREATLALLERSGFREYFDPLDGTGRGAHDFSWSAALALNMLADETVPLPAGDRKGSAA